MDIPNNQLEQFKKQYQESQLPDAIKANVIAQSTKLQRALEAIDLGAGYSLEDTFTTFSSESSSHMTEMRADAKDAALFHPSVIAPRGAIHAWTSSKGSFVHSDNDELNDTVQALVNSKFSNAFNVRDNIDHELMDGGVYFRISHMGGDQIIIRDVSIDSFDTNLSIKSSIDGETTWLHAFRTVDVKGEELVIFYPDIRFYPNDKAISAITERVEKLSKTEQLDFIIEWGSRIFTLQFNMGVPLLFPITKFVACVDAVIGLQSAVLQSIAAVSSYASIQDPDERYDAYVALNNARPGEHKDIIERTEQILRETDAGTAVTSGKISTLNLTIAMLQETSALYKLLTHAVYNAVPGLDPTDWAEQKKYSLGDTGQAENSTQVAAGMLRQEEHGDMYIDLIEACLVIFITNGIPVPGITLEQFPVNLGGQSMVNHFSVTYTEPGDLIEWSWPEIATKNLLQTVEAMVKGLTLDGKIGKPLGKPSDVVTIFGKLGLIITAPEEGKDDWDEYRIGESHAEKTMASAVGNGTTNTNGDQDSNKDEEESPAEESFRRTLESFNEAMDLFGGTNETG